MTRRLDPDRLAALEEERDFLLRSIEDLDAEAAAGDITTEDLTTLRDDYTARAAEVIVAIAEHREAHRQGLRPTSRRRLVLTSVGVAALVVVAAAVLASAVGTRPPGASSVGDGGTLRERLARCQPLAFQKPKEAIGCYDEILDSSPGNLEALTYRGWARLRSGDRSGAAEDFDRVVALDPTYADVFVFRAVLAKQSREWATARAELDRFFSLDPPAGAVAILDQMGTEFEIDHELLAPGVRACFDRAQAFLRATTATGSTTTTPGSAAGSGSTTVDDTLVGVFACVDKQIAARPTDVTPLILRGYLLATSGSPELAGAAAATIDRAVAVGPEDPTARLLRAAFRSQNGDPGGAIADLDVLEGLGRPSVLFGLASPDVIRSSAEEQQGAG